MAKETTETPQEMAGSLFDGKGIAKGALEAALATVRAQLEALPGAERSGEDSYVAITEARGSLEMARYHLEEGVGRL